MDYVVKKVHESRANPYNSNYTYTVIAIFTKKESAEQFIKKPEYEWRGNSGGSVGYKVRERRDDDAL